MERIDLRRVPEQVKQQLEPLTRPFSTALQVGVMAIFLAMPGQAHVQETSANDQNLPYGIAIKSSLDPSGQIEINISAGLYPQTYRQTWIKLLDPLSNKEVIVENTGITNGLPGPISLGGRVVDMFGNGKINLKPGATYVLNISSDPLWDGDIVKDIFTVRNFPGQPIKEADGENDYTQCGVTEQEKKVSPGKRAYGDSDTVFIRRIIEDSRLTYEMQDLGFFLNQCGNKLPSPFPKTEQISVRDGISQTYNR